MITNDQISQGAVTATKLSKNLRLPHTNLKAVDAGQVLLGDAGGNLSPTRISGDISISNSGVATLNRSSIQSALSRLGVIRQRDFAGANTMLFAVRDGAPKPVSVEELKVLLGIPSVFNSSTTETAFVGTAGEGGGLVKIKSFTETVGANPFVIDGFSDAFDTYKLVCHDAMSTGASTSDLGMRFVYGSTVISTNNYEFSRTLDTAETDWHSTSDGTQYGTLLVCMEDDHPGAFSIDIFNTRDTSMSAVLYSGLGTSNHGGSLAQYIPLGAMEWAGGIATADRKVSAMYLYPLTSSVVEPASGSGSSKIKGKFTLYGFKK